MSKADNKTAEPMLLDYRQVCAMLGISHQHLYNLRDTGRFPVPAVRLGRAVRYSRRHVEAWIDSGCSINWRARR